MVHKQLTEEDKKRCLFVATYERINPTTWRREGRPRIQPSHEEWPEQFSEPQVRAISSESHGPLVVEVRVLDPEAVDIKDRRDLLGNWRPAAERCDAALEQRYPGSCIINSTPVSDWVL